eukprot:TRINITY_DN7671_c0_g1_i6.p3 TRINITY_DN7671_c0_g1~~TRINITY_DN7671_c0_g1_i6.p3  ORF type:complete len:117 (-),score=10.42 TRINITY_DN7671_c0_g1_i6:320-670(-)
MIAASLERQPLFVRVDNNQRAEPAGFECSRSAPPSHERRASRLPSVCRATVLPTWQSLTSSCAIIFQKGTLFSWCHVRSDASSQLVCVADTAPTRTACCKAAALIEPPPCCTSNTS